MAQAPRQVRQVVQLPERVLPLACVPVSRLQLALAPRVPQARQQQRPYHGRVVQPVVEAAEAARRASGN